MEDECLARTPSGGDFDERLQQLAIEAKQQPPLSPQRQLILNRLVNKILQSNRLSYPQRGLWPPSLYEDLHNEAMQKTLLAICQKIDNYKPEHTVMAWVNYLLKKRFSDVVKKYRKQGITNVPPSHRNERVVSLNELEYSLISEEQTITDSQLLGGFLEDDPENILKNEHIRDYPQASFQYIAIARFVEGKTWEEISTELNGISIQTLSSFFNRQLRKLMPYFQKYL